MSVSAKEGKKSAVEAGVEDDELTVTLPGDEFSEKIENVLSNLGLGLSKEIAKTNAVQFTEVIKGVELVSRESASLPEEQFGRKLYKNLQAMFRHEWGTALQMVVLSNYSLTSFIDKRTAEIAEATGRLKDLEIFTTAPNPPNEAFYNKSAKVEYTSYMKKATEGVTTRSKDFEKEDSAKKLEITEKFDAMFVEEYNVYLTQLAAHQRHLKEMKKIESEKERMVVLGSVLDGLRSAENAIISKVKAAAGLHDKVKQKLSGMVILEATGESIDNPFDNNNLAGMVQILKSAYFTATLVHFNIDFQRTLGAFVSKDDMEKSPMKAVTLTEKNMSTWNTMNYFEYMTVDIFWTNMLLRSMPASDFQAKCVQTVNEFISRQVSADKEERSVRSAAGNKSMPIYQALRDYIENYELSGRHKTAAGQNNKVGANPLSQFGGRRGNVEMAHNATELFSALVGREKGIMCKNVETGYELPYTATAEACAVCHGKSTGAKVEIHKPRCYAGDCSKCGWYGHKHIQCRQHVSSYKKK